MWRLYGNTRDPETLTSYIGQSNLQLDINKRLVAPVQYELLEKFDFDPPSEPVDFIEINNNENVKSWKYITLNIDVLKINYVL